ncbi:DapH/DapD/GlmU-related protein [Thermodesulfobacteriota bacterium]
MARTPKVVAVSLDKDAIELIRNLNLELVGIIDSGPFKEYDGIPNLGKDDDWDRISASHGDDLKVIMLLDPPRLKKELIQLYGIENVIGIFAKDTKVSPSANIGRGCVLQSGVKILPHTILGICCKINLDVTIHHDCSVGDFCTLAPGSRLLGNVTLADEVFVGAGAIVLPGVSIGKNAIIGAGAVVTSNVAPETTVVGVPAAPIR